jgi:hypothetical protein
MALYRTANEKVGSSLGEVWDVICSDTLKQGYVEYPDRGVRRICFQDGSNRTEDISTPILVLKKCLPFSPKIGDVITFANKNHRITEIKGVGKFMLISFLNSDTKQNQEVYLDKVSQVIRMPHE